MKILADVKNNGQLINQIGKWMYNHIDGVYKIKRSGNMVDLYMEAYYQTPVIYRRDVGPEPIHVLKLNLSFTVYGDKIRFNMIEMGDYERTLLHKTYRRDDLLSPEDAWLTISQDMRKTLNKFFEGYDFVF